MRELSVDTTVQEDERGELLTCDYSILIGEMEMGGHMACESYGVAVRARESGEAACIPNITIRVDRIDALAELLVRGGVTPSAARDVVDDWLACE